MNRARLNPIGLPAPPGTELVRAGEGEHTHVLVKRNPGSAHLLCKSGGSQDFRPSDADFITCYRCIKLVEGVPGRRARTNPLTEGRDFGPSYMVSGRREYLVKDARCKRLADIIAEDGPDSAEAWRLYAKDKCKRQKHHQFPSGRRAARFREYGPSPADPKKGGPGRRDGRIVGGEARQKVRSGATKQRLDDRMAPWEARTQSLGVWTGTLQRMGYDVTEEDVAALSNPRRYGKRYGQRGPRPKVQQLTEAIAQAIEAYTAENPDPSGFRVPKSPYPLIRAGMPEKAAYILSSRAGGSAFLRAGVSRLTRRVGVYDALMEVLGDVRPVAKWEDTVKEPALSFVPVAGGRDKERGYVTDIQGRLASNAYTSLFDLRDSRQPRFGRSRYAAYRDAVSASTGEPYAADTYDEGYAAWLLDDVETRMQDRAERMGDDNARRSLRFYFSRLKKPVEIRFSPLQHSTATEEAEVEAPIGYRTFKNVSLAELPALLARVTLRKRHESRRTNQTEALENPMSYWDDQYSKSPYGARRSVPPARRNAGRPRTSKKTGPRTNMEGRNPTEWPMLREGQAKLKRLAAKGDKEAKRELEYRKILRADSSTSKSRGKSAKVTKGKNLSDWQAYLHESRGDGKTMAQKGADYRKKMAEPKRKTKSKAASKAKAAAPKNGRKVGWIAFWKHAAAAGYTMKQTQPLWQKYKAGKGTLASLLKPKKGGAKASKAQAKSTARKFAPGDIFYVKKSVRFPSYSWLNVPGEQPRGIVQEYHGRHLNVWVGTPSGGFREHAFTADQLRKATPAEKRAWEAQAKKTAPKRKAAAPKRKTTARSRAKGRKVSAKSPDVSKMRKGANRYRIFIKAMVADGYTPAEARAIWHEEKHNYFNNPRDLTHRREALVPSSQEDYWDNSVETALMNPEYEDYDDFDYGPFSTGLAHTHGVQPVNRRNPRRNPRRSRHPIYEQTRGQFGVSEAWTHGVQPYGRRNPAEEDAPWPGPGYTFLVGPLADMAPQNFGYLSEEYDAYKDMGSYSDGKHVVIGYKYPSRGKPASYTVLLWDDESASSRAAETHHDGSIAHGRAQYIRSSLDPQHRRTQIISRRNPAMKPRIESDGGIYVGSDEIGSFTVAPDFEGHVLEIFGTYHEVPGTMSDVHRKLDAWWAENGEAALAAGWGSSHANPSHSHTASDPWHPVYEQIIGQFSTSEPWTHGVQPYSRRNPYDDDDLFDDDF